MVGGGADVEAGDGPTRRASTVPVALITGILLSGVDSSWLTAAVAASNEVDIFDSVFLKKRHIKYFKIYTHIYLKQTNGGES